MPAFETIVNTTSAGIQQRVVTPARTGLGYQARVGLTLCVGLLATSSAGAHEVWHTDGRPASAALNITIVIPAVLRILENTHPLSLEPADALTARTSALQRMVLVSTLGKGFCMGLQLNQPQIKEWQLRISGSAGAWVEPVASGYKLCAARAGRYEVALQHDFALKEKGQQLASPPSAVDWPVNISLATP